MKILKKFVFSAAVFSIVVFNGCGKEKPDVRQIIDKSIEAHGGNLFGSSKIEFDFRNKHYSVERHDGRYKFTREFTDKKGNKITDVLDNKAFTRYINNKKMKITAERANAYSNSVNSVIYFALLPYGLNDKAVGKKLIGEVSIKGKDYYKIKITFSENGGGEDFQDVFIYWINKDTFTLDYLAYLYHVNGGGTRFREAVNSKIINGIRFSDYINYGTEGPGYNIENYDKDFEKGTLKKISEININNISVEKLSDK